MKHILAFLLLTFFAGFARAEIYVAAPNTPDRIKQRPGVRVCKTTDEIQAALDDAWKDEDDVVMHTGAYSVTTPLHAYCSIRGEGAARFRWDGKKSKDFILTVTGVDGAWIQPSVSNLWFDGGQNGSSGLLVKNVHRAELSGLRFYRCRGTGLKVLEGWVLLARNIRVAYCHDCQPVYLSGFSAGILDMLSIVHCENNGPIVRISGCADVRQLGIENCDAGKNPVVLLESFWAGSVSGYITEENKGTSHLLVQNTDQARISRLSHWQTVDSPMPVGVVVKDCRHTVLDGMRAWNTSEALVRFIGCDPRDTYCKHLHHEDYGQDWGVQPKRLIEYVEREKGE